MQTGTAINISPPRGNTSRVLGLAAALGLTLAMAGCGEGVSDASGFAAENEQTSAGAAGEATIGTDVVGNEGVQLADQPPVDADEVPEEPEDTLADSETPGEEDTVARNDSASDQRAAPGELDL